MKQIGKSLLSLLLDLVNHNCILFDFTDVNNNNNDNNNNNNANIWLILAISDQTKFMQYSDKSIFKISTSFMSIL